MKPKKSIGTNSPKVELTFCERSKGRIHIGLKSVKSANVFKRANVVIIYDEKSLS